MDIKFEQILFVTLKIFVPALSKQKIPKNKQVVYEIETKSICDTQYI